jgi:TatD DNase family protein
MSVSNPEPPVQRGMVDTHCHLFLIEEEPSLVVEAARGAGVDRVICVGIDPETSARSLELADSIAGVFATAGIHPHEASNLDAGAGARIEELLHDPRVVGVGECGLDFYRMHSPVEDQLRALELQIALSNESGKPLVVHCRDAWPEVLRALDEGSAERVVLHCFSGDATVARACAERGYWLSFAGNVTYPKNEHLRDAARVVDISRLLVETDAPFLAPQRLRGRDNAPANVIDAIEAIAAARDVDVATVAEATTTNAKTAFDALR